MNYCQVNLDPTGIMGWALDKAMISDFVDWLRVIGNPRLHRFMTS